jgi:thioredoxin reductase
MAFMTRKPVPGSRARPRLLILGGGPIGIEAALYALHLGYDARVLEAAEVGSHPLAWGHVTMFSPWEMNCSPLGLRILARRGARPFAAAGDRPTGREYVRSYLVPLARALPLRGRILERTRAVAVGRHGITKGDLIGDPERARRPFRILAVRDGREEIRTADLVLDATGTFGQHRWLGSGGIPAPGERAAAGFIDYRIPDVAGSRAREYAGRRTLLVGSGTSAATSAVALASLLRRDPRTRVVWAYRRDSASPCARIPGDPLPARDRLSVEANAIARGSAGGLHVFPRTVVESIAPARGGIAVTLGTAGRLRRAVVDRIIANVGYAPDRSIYAELQVHECYATAGPIKLAAALLGEWSGDCLTQPAASADLLANPEPAFYILGSKSYGRNPAFLLRSGLDQIRTLFASLEKDPALDLYAPSFRAAGAPAGAGRARERRPPAGRAVRAGAAME